MVKDACVELYPIMIGPGLTKRAGNTPFPLREPVKTGVSGSSDSMVIVPYTGVVPEGVNVTVIVQVTGE
jgi:hypothetical protein